MLPYLSTTVWTYKKDDKTLKEETNEVMYEHRCELIVNGISWLSFICSPSNLDDLAIGFLWNENIISDLSEIKSLTVSADGNSVTTELTHPVEKPRFFHRTSTGMSLQHEQQYPQVTTEPELTADEIIALYERFSQQQQLHDDIGGFHSAALTDGKEIPIQMEDLGRHNCIDKIAGRYLQQKKPFTIKAILLTGRVSSEMILKSLALKSPLIVTRTAPSYTAIQVANQVGVTLIGYLRHSKFTVYAHPERLRFD